MAVEIRATIPACGAGRYLRVSLGCSTAAVHRGGARVRGSQPSWRELARSRGSFRVDSESSETHAKDTSLFGAPLLAWRDTSRQMGPPPYSPQPLRDEKDGAASSQAALEAIGGKAEVNVG